MNRDILREAERLFRPREREAKGPSGPLIVVREDGPVLHEYRDTEDFYAALDSRHAKQTITTMVQVSDTPTLYPDGSPILDKHGRPVERKPSDWKDAEVWAGPFEWGGMVGKDLDLAGRPHLPEPTFDELCAVRDRHGAFAARVLHRTNINPVAEGVDPGQAVRAIHGG